MKFTCSKDTLSEAISICSHAVSAKASTPILEGLLIRVQNGEVTMTGFNYKTGIQRTFAADRTEDGEVVLNARILGDIVRKMPAADMLLSVLVRYR
jgi:DNA polymerase-3 subunit beta